MYSVHCTGNVIFVLEKNVYFLPFTSKEKLNFITIFNSFQKMFISLEVGITRIPKGNPNSMPEESPLMEQCHEKC